MDFSFKCHRCGSRNHTTVEKIGTIMRCAECNIELEVPLTAFSSGIVQGDYWIHHKVGTGAVSEVYVTKLLSTAHGDDENANKVFLKVMSPLATVDKQATERFYSNILQSQSVDHPNVLPVTDTGIMKGHYFAATPYVEGECLNSIIERDGPLDEPEALNVCLRVARLMQQVWNDHRLTHQALKPANILINADQEIFLLDLGNSKLCLVPEHGRIESINPKGNLFDYMSPEQIQNLPDLDPTSDIYSLGASLHFMIVGEKPYTDTMTSSIIQKHLWSPPPQLETYDREISPETADLVRWMMSAKGSDDSRTWEELISRICSIHKRLAKGKGASTSSRSKIKPVTEHLPHRKHSSSRPRRKLKHHSSSPTTSQPSPEDAPAPPIKKSNASLALLIATIVCLASLVAGGAILVLNRNGDSNVEQRLDDDWLTDRLKLAQAESAFRATNATRHIQELEKLKKQTKDEKQLSKIADVLRELESTWASSTPVAKPDKPTTHTIQCEADAYIQGGKYASKNFGRNESMAIKNAGKNSDVTRRAYLRFNLSELPRDVTSVKLRLYSHGVGKDAGPRGIQLVADDNWSEDKIAYKTAPAPSGTDLGTFQPLKNAHVVIDLTEAVKQQRAADEKISLFIYGKKNTGGTGYANIAARNHKTENLRPVLIVQCGQASGSAQPGSTTPTPSPILPLMIDER